MNATRITYGARITGDRQPSAAVANKRDALQLLDAMNDYGAEAEQLIGELMFGFGYTRKVAEGVYNEWMEAAG